MNPITLSYYILALALLLAAGKFASCEARLPRERWPARNWYSFARDAALWLSGLALGAALWGCGR